MLRVPCFSTGFDLAAIPAVGHSARQRPRSLSRYRNDLRSRSIAFGVLGKDGNQVLAWGGKATADGLIAAGRRTVELARREAYSARSGRRIRIILGRYHHGPHARDAAGGRDVFHPDGGRAAGLDDLVGAGGLDDGRIATQGEAGADVAYPGLRSVGDLTLAVAKGGWFSESTATDWQCVD